MNTEFFIKDERDVVWRKCVICFCELNLCEFIKANKEIKKYALISIWENEYVALLCCDCVNLLNNIENVGLEEIETNYPTIINNLLRYGLI
jgi:hypothetical protein